MTLSIILEPAIVYSVGGAGNTRKVARSEGRRSRAAAVVSVASFGLAAVITPGPGAVRVGLPSVAAGGCSGGGGGAGMRERTDGKAARSLKLRCFGRASSIALMCSSFNPFSWRSRSDWSRLTAASSTDDEPGSDAVLLPEGRTGALAEAPSCFLLLLGGGSSGAMSSSAGAKRPGA